MEKITRKLLLFIALFVASQSYAQTTVSYEYYDRIPTVNRRTEKMNMIRILIQRGLRLWILVNGTLILTNLERLLVLMGNFVLAQVISMMVLLMVRTHHGEPFHLQILPLTNP